MRPTDVWTERLGIMKNREAESVGLLIRKLLREEGLETPLNERRLVNSWTEVLGPNIAHYTRQVSIRNQVLYVQLSSSVLRQELLMGKAKLIKSLNDNVGAQVINDIVIY